MWLLDAAPMNDGEVAFAVLLETATVAMVVWAAPAGVVAPAAAEAGAVPAIKAAEAVELPVMVLKTTWGTVMTVDSTVVLDEDEPDDTPAVAVQGTTMVVRICTVVTGTVGAGVDVPLDEATLGAQVTMAGLEEMCAAQMPWK